MEDDLNDLQPGDLSRLKIPWHKKLLLKFFPRLFLKMSAREMDIDYSIVVKAGEIFGDGKKIHIQPLSGQNRGFIIFVDNKISYWFFQEGDHFEYDGFEMGEYDDGDVQVFDGLKRS